MAEYRTPTLDTRTSSIGIIDKVVEEYDKYKMYFMNVANDDALAAETDFIYLISSVRSQAPASQYVKLEVPIPMTGINVSASAKEFWTDTGGLGGGISTLSPIPSRKNPPPDTATSARSSRTSTASTPITAC